MTETTTNDKPTPLAEWLSAYQTKFAAIGQAVEELCRHVSRMPDPRSAQDVRALLDFRQERFRLDDEPANRDTREHAAEDAARFLADAQRRVQGSLAKMLENTEMVLAIDAKDNRNGLFAPDLLPRESFHLTNGQVHLVNRFALPEDHPLRGIDHEWQRFPWLWLCPGAIGYRMDGLPVTVLPQWATLSSVRRVANQLRADTEKEARAEAERYQRRLEEERARELRELSNEQRLLRRVEQLEKQMAEQNREGNTVATSTE